MSIPKNTDNSHSHDRLSFGGFLAFLILFLPLALAAKISPDSYGANLIRNRGLVEDIRSIPGAASSFASRSKAIESAASQQQPSLTITADATPSPSPKYIGVPEQTPLPRQNPDSEPALPSNDYEQPIPSPSQPWVNDALKPNAAGCIKAEIIDLLYAAQEATTRKDFEGKKVEIIGQVVPNKLRKGIAAAPAGSFKLLRLVIVCCAADAMPVAVKVQTNLPATADPRHAMVESDRASALPAARKRGFGWNRLRRLSRASDRGRFDQEDRTRPKKSISIRAHQMFLVRQIFFAAMVIALVSIAARELRAESSFSTVVIDPGHGGFDRGGIPGQIVPEKMVALDTALRLQKLLQRAGLRTVMTRTTDVFVPLSVRSAIANAEHDAIFVSIHYNAAPRSGAHGIETYSENNRGAALAARIQRDIVTRVSTENRGIRSAEYYVLRNCRLPAVLVECGFLTNPTEAQLALTPGLSGGSRRTDCRRNH